MREKKWKEATIKVLICGSRKWANIEAVERVVLARKDDIDLIIAGGAKGADKIAELVAHEQDIPCEIYNAEWHLYGKGAGPIRNAQMLHDGKPDLVLAFHENIEESKGTKNMLFQAQVAGVPVELFTE